MKKMRYDMKECIICGCIIPDDHDGDICECCLDDMYPREEDSP